MADEADYADEVIQQLLANPVNPFARNARIKPNGTCHNCQEPLADAEQEVKELLFCDADCAKDWMRRDDARVRNGG